MTDSLPPTALGVFLKFWQPGRVKTRLAKAIGNRAASELYLTMVRKLLRTLEGQFSRAIIAFDPPQRRTEIAQEVGDTWELTEQCDGDLGQRLEQFFRQTLEESDRVLVIGTDLPTLSRSDLREAAQGLERHEVVLGPSEDGGYYLIGVHPQAGDERIAQLMRLLFRDMPWSTSSLYEQTVQRLVRNKISFLELPTRFDIDEWDDVKRLDGWLTRSQPSDAFTKRIGEFVARHQSGSPNDPEDAGNRP